MSDLRDIVNAAVAEILHDHGPTNSDHLKATADWRDCPRSEVHAAFAATLAGSPLVSALLDVVDLARKEAASGSPYTNFARKAQIKLALERLAALETTMSDNPA